MQVGDIIEINELARVAAGVFQTGDAGAPRRIDVGGGDRILAVCSARPKYNQQFGGYTSQVNLADEHLEYAMTGETTAVTAASKSAQFASAMPLNYAVMNLHHIPPFIFPFRDVAAGATWSTLTAPTWQRFQNSFAHVHNILNTGDYLPVLRMAFPLKNRTASDITVTLPASSVAGSATGPTYDPHIVSTIINTNPNPSLTDTPTVTHHSTGGSSAYSNANAAAITFTIPAGCSGILVLLGHYWRPHTYSNQYSYGANVGLRWDAVAALYQSGLTVDVNILNALMIDSASGINTANKYAELFVPQDDAYTGEK